MSSESLANLARIGLLDPVPFSAVLLQKMLHLAQSECGQDICWAVLVKLLSRACRKTVSERLTSSLP